jgi:hypothetical protein
MKVNRAGFWAVVGLAALVAGCAQVKAYEPIANLGEAEAAAGLIVAGEVQKAETVKHFAGKEVTSAGLGKVGSDCVAENRVTLKVDRTVKGPKQEVSPVTFLYYSPCFHPEKGIKVENALPAIMQGDKVVVYLEKRDNDWWLIAHKVETAAVTGRGPSKRIEIYTGNY